MAKIKSRFVCNNCAFESPKWWGVCPECGDYGSMVEEIIENKGHEEKVKRGKNHISVAVDIKQVKGREEDRFSTGITEFDRVLGGGIVKGSLVLVGGEPGIGKSTILLQMAQLVSEREKVLYISGEESKEQIKLRANRMYTDGGNLLLLTETNIDKIEDEIIAQSPRIVIIDSIQTMYSSEITSIPGSVSQIRESTARLMSVGKKEDIAIFVVGHVTKEGSIAGPKVLEHLVDTVIYFEGERFNAYRMLRAIKNRFGSTNELGVFEMTEKGLMEIGNPSAMMLSEKPLNVSGSVIVATMEGTRPMLTEVQALVSPSSFAVPRRTATGVDGNRMNMIIAVLEKRAGLAIQNHDIYVNLTGGMRSLEPSIDLGIALAIASSFKNKPVDDKTVIFGEVGLTGEVRSVSHGDRRINEAIKLGFERIIMPKGNVGKEINIEVRGVGNIIEAIRKAY
ncbi:MAG: DNA repair protein RadA [Filifactoraceae bacterium]